MAWTPAFRNIGQPSISVKCVGLTVAKTLADVKWMSKSGPYYDTNAEVDFYYMMAYAKDKPADHVMAFTRSNIRFNEAGSEIAGVALFAGACSDQRLSIVKDEGLHSWGVARTSWHTVWARTTTTTSHSARNGAKNATCLKSRQSTAKAVLTSNASEGARLTLDQVCRLAFPSTPGHFYLQTASLMTPAAICAKIHCSLTELALKPVTKSGLRAPVGTPCGNKRSCNWNGQCTADSAAPSAGSSFWGQPVGIFTL
uniref:ADAM_CR_2 domain-containing protein n=1 Tax=Macrostomum lignano TaxID=282301 RepID=A0A1I8J9B4_9PLAT